MHSALHRQFDSQLEEKIASFVHMGEVEDPFEEDEDEEEVYDDHGDDADNLITFEFAEIPIREFQEIPDPEYYQVWDASGAVLAQSPSLQTVDLKRLESVSNAVTIHETTLPDGRPGKIAAASFIPNIDGSSPQDNTDGPVLTLAIAKSTEELERILGTVRTGLLGISLLSIAAAVCTIFLSVKRGLKPLDRLGNSIRQLDMTELDTQLSAENVPAEIQPVVTCLNELLQRMEAAFKRERRFNSDVAHELRTPISELLALSEVSGNRANIDDDTRYTFQDTHAIGKRMEKIVHALLEISRCEAGLIPLEEGAANIESLIQSNWKPFMEMAERKQISFEIDAASTEEWITDAVLFGAVLTNIFSNAVSYTPEGGSIKVTIEQLEGELCIRVTNTTSEIEEEDIEHIFDTFWRKDSSRSDSDHLGVGLSLVQAIASILNLNLTASMVDANQFELKILYPAPGV